jgi:hypothetical protein
MTTFALITAPILLGMLSIRFWHVSGKFYSTLPATLSHNSCTPLGGLDSCSEPFEMYPEVFNGVEVRGLGWPFHNFNVVVFKPFCQPFWRCVWGHCPAESILSPSVISSFSKLSTIPSSKISQYCSASIFPTTSVSVPTPFQPIHPHTIRLFPPPCLTVGRGSPI